ncbi:hypothetical protein QAD02_020843 [Eretmocerus hayati]|uniref:Uncharacterized protein n=1 Tax=Eretmocerus hayati TaxID=131215 RepID=A0ACC2PTD0_9HYME|nr:hypothetical protein QAD02_020843 [Eretmocerus hayati]
MDASDGSTGEFVYIRIEKKHKMPIKPELHPGKDAGLVIDQVFCLRYTSWGILETLGQPWISKACKRCFIVGKKVNGVTVFLRTDAVRRTNESFRNFAGPDCHHGVTMLVFLEDLDFIYQFLLDPMHSVYSGPGKRLLDFLLGEPKKKKCKEDVKLSSALKMELDRRTKMIKGDIPDEFPRKMREISKYHQYKAVEHTFMLQCAGPIVFKKIMQGDLYKHFMLLSMGCRLLSGRNVAAHVAQVRGLFLEFVQKAPSLYGQEFVSILVHCLIHICDDVERYGLNLAGLSAFEFGSYLGFISSWLR